ncbi:MAG TPA: hypothetical protein VLM38_04375 [Blastocatellia bacterium]|nr:hypothetical protein [Blastocatellia bacterium]
MSFTLTSSRVEDLDTPDAHVTLIRSQWRDFAAFAWDKYSSEGRGALVIDLRNASRSGGNLEVPTFWVADGGERLSARGGWPSEEIAEVIKDYDPQLDVVFLVLRLDGDVFHYNASDELTPPQAFNERRPARSK